MSKVNFEIWGRTLELDVVYDCYRGEEILESQKRAYNLFCDNSVMLFNKAYEEVIAYCYKTNKEELGDTEITNIFKYVKPKTIYVERSTNDDRIVGIICAYKFNPDDGMAIIFKNEAFFNIGTENIIL